MYTSFVTQKGQFEFLYVPIGNKNFPAVFYSGCNVRFY